MLSNFWRGAALVVVWIFGACVYQSYIRQEHCLPLAMPTDRKVIKQLPLLIEEAEISHAQILEQQVNEMSVEFIELKMTQGIPNGY